MNTYATPTRPYTDFELTLVKEIETHGFRVNSVLTDHKTKEPQFSYSIGIQKTCGAPDLIVFGLRPRLAHHLIWEYFERVKQGESLPPHKRHWGLLDGYGVFLQPARRKSYEKHMLSCNWFYGAGNYEASQLIYPHPKGQWPWSEDATPRFCWEQPLICPVPLGQRREAVRRRKPLDNQRLYSIRDDSPSQ